MGVLRRAQNLVAQFLRQHHLPHGEAVLICPVCLPVARSMISTSPPDGVATCSTSLPASVLAETMRAPGARVMTAAALDGPFEAALDAVLAAMTIWAWRTKPQMAPKRASTTSTVMIMTITQAVRRLVAGGEDW